MKKNKGYFLGFGLGSVDPKKYFGWSGKLLGTEPDIYLFASKLKPLGYSTKKVLTKKATIENFKLEIIKLSGKVKSNDLVVIVYSGHGGQIRDKSSDEIDGLDETYCFFNGEMTDDYMFECLKLLPPCRVLMFSDACHSGTSYRNLTSNVPKFRSILNESSSISKASSTDELQCSLKFFGACHDEQVASDLGTNGLFTKILWECIDRNPNVTWDELYNIVLGTMPEYQLPTYKTLGKINESFNKQSLFTI